MNEEPSVSDRQKGDWIRELQRSDAAVELGSDLFGLGLELVRLAGDGLSDEERGTLMTAVTESLIGLRQGSTRIPATPELVALANSERASDVLSTTAHAYRPLLVVDGWLYHQRTLHYERSLADLVRQRLDHPAEDVASTARPSSRLTEEQEAAVDTAIRLPLCVITGGPGTGKTSIVVELLRRLVSSGVAPERIALAAPTGKAANRMGEAITTQLGEGDEALREALATNPPSTLHRLLRYRPAHGSFARDETDPIAARWVVVDEASMIDLVLMERLMRCVHPDAHLVLLGDVEQLPSVDTGTVLRDLVSREDHVARLHHSFRMDPRDPAGRQILRFAEAVRDGEPRSAVQRLGGAVTLEEVDDDSYRGRLLAFVEEWFDDRITGSAEFWDAIARTYRLEEGIVASEDVPAVRALFDHYGAFRILCLTRVFAGGSVALNEAFHARLMRRTETDDAVGSFIAGEPVLMLRNDYDRGLFNGDHGVILRVDTGDDVRLAAIFESGGVLRAHHLSGLQAQLDHAWAMTVHKSQGSEFEEVAVVLPEEDIPLLSRELLYTAVTRARRRVRIFGDPSFLCSGIERVTERYSGLAEQIGRARPIAPDDPGQ